MGLHKIYVELVFLDNFIVNLLIILLTSRLTRTMVRWWRFCAAAALGGAYAGIAIGMGNALIWLPIKAVVGLGMCLIAFLRRGEQGFWKNVCAFWAASFLLAGAVYAAMLGFGEPATIGGAIIVRPPVRYVLIGLFVGAVVTERLAYVRRWVREREAHAVELVLRLEDRQTTVSAFVDTGNWAREPLTGLSVVFLSRAAASELLGGDYMALVDGQAGEPTPRLRIVPCETAAGSGVFYGIELDAVSLREGAYSRRAVVCVSNRPIAGGFGAIAGASLIDELKKGATYEDAGDKKTGCADTDSAAAGCKCRLHKRKRGAAASADAGGGRKTALHAQGRGRVGQTGAD